MSKFICSFPTNFNTLSQEEWGDRGGALAEDCRGDILLDRVWNGGGQTIVYEGHERLRSIELYAEISICAKIFGK